MFIPSLFFYFFLIMFIPMMVHSASDVEALLKLKDSFDNPQPLDSWKHGLDPCDKVTRWVGVLCSNGIVSDLRLRQLGLSGRIDIDALAQIEGLRTISLDDNAFSGPIPEFNRLGALKALYLTGNQFTGEIPYDYFAKMVSMKKLWLAKNNFSGSIPSSLTIPSHLMDLHVEDNHFSGQIPALEQKTLESVGFSNNNLSGRIPASLERFDAKDFKGNPGLCGDKLGKACDQAIDQLPVTPSRTHAEKIRDTSISIALSLMLLVILILVLMIIGICMLISQRKKEKNAAMVKDKVKEPSVEVSVSSIGSKKDIGGGGGGGVEVSVSSIGSKKEMGGGSSRGSRRSSSRKGSNHGGNKGVGDLVLVNEDKGVFGLADLMKAAAEVLGNGALGSSYKAIMTNGMTVVVKRLKEMNKMGKEGFDVEMKRLGQLKHRNILSMLAYHYRKEEKLLIYDYIPKGSLLFLLHGDRGSRHGELTWPVRLKIIRGIAQGLGYLHSELSILDLPHGDLKSSNVLLDSEFEPLLVDYGLCSLINTNQSVQALVAYKSPEAAQHLQVSPKCDIFCLGIIILEIITRKFPCQYLTNGQGAIDVVQWVKSAILEGREGDLFDPEIIAGCSKDCVTQMEKLIHIGAACTESIPDNRPDITEAIRRIEEVAVEPSMAGGRIIQILPSLRDGYGDIPVMQTQQSTAHVSFVTDQEAMESGRQIGNSFAFHIS